MRAILQIIIIYLFSLCINVTHSMDVQLIVEEKTYPTFYLYCMVHSKISNFLKPKIIKMQEQNFSVTQTQDYVLLNRPTKQLDGQAIEDLLMNDNADEYSLFKQYLDHREIVAKSNTLIERCLASLGEGELLYDIKIRLGNNPLNQAFEKNYPIKAYINDHTDEGNSKIFFTITSENRVKIENEPPTKLDSIFIQNLGDFLTFNNVFKHYQEHGFKGYTNIDELTSMRFKNGEVHFYSKDSIPHLIEIVKKTTVALANDVFVCMEQNESNESNKALSNQSNLFILKKLDSELILSNPDLLAAVQKVEDREITIIHRKIAIKKFLLKAVQYSISFGFDVFKKLISTGSKAAFNTPIEMNGMEKLMIAIVDKTQKHYDALSKEDRERFDLIKNNKEQQARFIDSIIEVEEEKEIQKIARRIRPWDLEQYELERGFISWKE